MSWYKVAPVWDKLSPSEDMVESPSMAPMDASLSENKVFMVEQVKVKSLGPNPVTHVLLQRGKRM